MTPNAQTKFWICPGSLAFAVLLFGNSLHAQTPCPARADTLIANGWESYRSQGYARADSLFGQVLDICATHTDARIGRAYARLQQGQTQFALGEFRAVASEFPRHVDALTGVALALWRLGQPEDALRMFRVVANEDPDNQLAATYLNRIAEIGRLMPRPPERTSDTLVMWSRSHGRHFDIQRNGQWEPLYINGINLGAALPGRHPSQFPDSLTYVQWLNQMGEIGFNTIRVYTHHPPHFYQALREYNLAHPDAPLWLIHGAWTELPPNGRYDSPEWRNGFFTEMRRSVDIVHGAADRGLADDLVVPYYNADVSPWTLAYIIGREWEPSSLAEYETHVPNQTEWDGEYFTVTHGRPSEVMVAEAMEVMVKYETEVYGHQRPVAYTSWPTLDPLHHVSEATRDEQRAFRAAAGYPLHVPERKAENDDEINMDPGALRPTPSMVAGTFGVFHAYPYYPDFMINDPAHQAGRSPDGPSNYFAYLTRLRERIPDIPLIVGEYGVPTSIINAHLQPQGWHHGGHSEPMMAEIDARLTREIAAAGFAGGAVFAWVDEWFKKNWLVIDFEIPGDRNRIWWNRLDAEQHYGMYAMEPEPRLGDGNLADRMDTWRNVDPLYLDRWGTLRVTHDEAYLHLFYEHADTEFPDELLIGFDIVDPEAGDFQWPGRTHEAPVGLEFVLSVRGNEARLLADSASNPIEVIEIGWTLGDSVDLVFRDITANRPPGFFAGRYTQAFPDSVVTHRNADGRYEALRVVSNDTRIGRDTTEYAGMGYDRGVLPPGSLPDGMWERVGNTLEVRIPWMLLNFTDPSQRRILQGAVGATDSIFETMQIEDIGIVMTARDRGGWLQWPVPGGPDPVARYTWPAWEGQDIRWRTRKRPVADALRETYRRLRPPVLQEHHHR